MALGQGTPGGKPENLRGKGNAGRPTGAKNKIGAQCKANVIEVFDKIGGIEGMVQWAQENRTEFYKLYARLIPTDITVTTRDDVRDLTDDELALIAAAGSIGADRPPDGTTEPGGVH